MTVLFDSSAWLEYFFGSEKGERLQQFVEDSRDIIVSKINLFEVYHKILKESGREEAERFVSFILLKSVVDDMDVETIKFAAEEKKKLGLSMADALILATAIKYDATLYTTDRDFEGAQTVAKIEFL